MSQSAEPTVLALVSNVVDVRPSRSQLADGRDRDAVLAAVHDAFGSTGPPDRLPAPQPVSLDMRALGVLRSHREDYLCTLKADGERFLLVMLVVDEEPLAVMVSRRLDVFEIPVVAQLRHFNPVPRATGSALAGTVLDGELVVRGDGLQYLVFDALVVDGRYLRDDELTSRIQHVYKYCEVYNLGHHATTEQVEAIAQEQDKIVPLTADPMIRITAKRWWVVGDLGRMWAERAQLGCPVDGVVFMRRRGVTPGTDRTMFKWKAAHTVDVWLATPNEPLVAVAGRVCPWAAAFGEYTVKTRKRARSAIPTPVVSVEHNQLVEVLMQNQRDSASTVVECEMTLHGDDVLLRPVRERPDKTVANDVSTVYRTIAAARDSIDLTRLAEACAGKDARR